MTNSVNKNVIYVTLIIYTLSKLGGKENFLNLI